MAIHSCHFYEGLGPPLIWRSRPAPKNIKACAIQFPDVAGARFKIPWNWHPESFWVTFCQHQILQTNDPSSSYQTLTCRVAKKKLWTWSCRVDWSSDFVSLCRWSICRGFSFVVRWFFRSWNVSLFSSMCVFLKPWWIDLSLWIVKMWHLKELDLQNKVRIIS